MRTKGSLNKKTIEKLVLNSKSTSKATAHQENVSKDGNLTITSLPEKNMVDKENAFQLSAREIFIKNYGNAKNQLTPEIIKYGKLRRDIAYEFSKGSIIFEGKQLLIFAVTVTGINKAPSDLEKYIKMSKSFATEKEASNYIYTLKNDNL